MLKPVNGEYDVLDMHQVANPGPDAANGCVARWHRDHSPKPATLTCKCACRHIKAGGVQDIPLGSNDAELDKVVEYAVGQYRALHGANGFKGHPRIIKAQRQVVAGIKYIVTLEDDQGITFQLVAVSQPWITDDPIHVEQFEPQAPNARVQLLVCVLMPPRPSSLVSNQSPRPRLGSGRRHPHRTFSGRVCTRWSPQPLHSSLASPIWYVV